MAWPSRRLFGEQMPLGTPEITILLVIFFLLFGAERLPKLARALGQAKGEFNEGLKDLKEAGTDTEDDLERGGRTESVAIAEKAEDAGVEIEGKTPDEVVEESE
ncbi:MAG: twin-arginine translocase TatA/TatE family subunit [Candidatus Thermoplasmatota archaeon]|nr:twin-arginine translocase TatA/TatE family subunit [Candidatus Thermoplasmatota archaeon]